MSNRLRILVLTKRQYTNKDLIDDRFGRIREIPLQLARKSHSVYGLCLSFRERKRGIFQDEHVRWESINAGPLFIGGLVRYAWRAVRLAPEADVIWACSDSLFGIIALLIGRAWGVPVAFDLYDNFESFLVARLPIFRSLYRWAVRKCGAVTVASRPLQDLVRSYGRTQGAYLLENAVEPGLFHPLDQRECRAKFGLPAEALIIGTAGALSKHRGIETLFQAFRLLAQQCPNLHLALAGPRDIGVPNHPRIHDMGILAYDRIPQFLNALDVGVICNMKTAFGNYCCPQKAREMMACGLPIAAARVGSMKDLLKEHPGWLFDPGSPSDFARAIENCLESGPAGYGTLPSWRGMAEILERIFLSLSNPRNARRVWRESPPHLS